MNKDWPALPEDYGGIPELPTSSSKYVRLHLSVESFVRSGGEGIYLPMRGICLDVHKQYWINACPFTWDVQALYDSRINLICGTDGAEAANRPLGKGEYGPQGWIETLCDIVLHEQTDIVKTIPEPFKKETNILLTKTLPMYAKQKVKAMQIIDEWEDKWKRLS